jgi:GMP synthase (glutamine-hydrolysing)
VPDGAHGVVAQRALGAGASAHGMSRSSWVGVVNFGAQYAQLIARRVRECGVYSEIVNPDAVDSLLRGSEPPAALILSGGPDSAYEPGARRIEASVLERGVPVLGICYGAQLMAELLGGRVKRTPFREYGPAKLERLGESSVLLADFNGTESVWMSHQDAITEPPPGAVSVARTEGAPVAVFEDQRRRLFGVQFHPEVAHTPKGIHVIKRFLYEGAGLSPTWHPEDQIEAMVEGIRQQVGQAKVLCALSGGVDSTVVAYLLARAVGRQAVCVFVDTGLLREGEADQVRSAVKDLPLDFVCLDASGRFLAELEGVTDPEEKRLRIGRAFVEVFEDVARGRPDIKYLAQGTLYPDVVESGSGGSAKIKSHHNVGGLPEALGFQLVEPLRHLFKDEVRAIGRKLGVPQDILNRHPFPGPGLAVRVAGEVTRERLDILRAADSILTEELKYAGLYESLWQAFVVLLPVRSVGVMGDARTYEHPIVVRAVAAQDGMTADPVFLPEDLVRRLTARLVAEVQGINRVLVDVTPKPPATIEWE